MGFFRLLDAWAAVAVAGALVTGCGPARPPLVPVAGVVTLDGEPVSGGAVRVIPQNARAATGAIGPDGRFTLGTFAEADGCVVGTHVVEVMPPPTSGDERSPAPAKPASFPTRYISAETSGLTVTITGPTSDLVISLTK